MRLNRLHLYLVTLLALLSSCWIITAKAARPSVYATAAPAIDPQSIVTAKAAKSSQNPVQSTITGSGSPINASPNAAKQGDATSGAPHKSKKDLSPPVTSSSDPLERLTCPPSPAPAASPVLASHALASINKASLPKSDRSIPAKNSSGSKSSSSSSKQAKSGRLLSNPKAKNSTAVTPSLSLPLSLAADPILRLSELNGDRAMTKSSQRIPSPSVLAAVGKSTPASPPKPATAPKAKQPSQSGSKQMKKPKKAKNASAASKEPKASAVPTAEKSMPKKAPAATSPKPRKAPVPKKVPATPCPEPQKAPVPKKTPAATPSKPQKAPVPKKTPAAAPSKPQKAPVPKKTPAATPSKPQKAPVPKKAPAATSPEPRKAPMPKNSSAVASSNNSSYNATSAMTPSKSSLNETIIPPSTHSNSSSARPSRVVKPKTRSNRTQTGRSSTRKPSARAPSSLTINTTSLVGVLPSTSQPSNNMSVPNVKAKASKAKRLRYGAKVGTTPVPGANTTTTPPVTPPPSSMMTPAPINSSLTATNAVNTSELIMMPPNDDAVVLKPDSMSNESHNENVNDNGDLLTPEPIANSTSIEDVSGSVLSSLISSPSLNDTDVISASDLTSNVSSPMPVLQPGSSYVAANHSRIAPTYSSKSMNQTGDISNSLTTSSPINMSSSASSTVSSAITPTSSVPNPLRSSWRVKTNTSSSGFNSTTTTYPLTPSPAVMPTLPPYKPDLTEDSSLAPEIEVILEPNGTESGTGHLSDYSVNVTKQVMQDVMQGSGNDTGLNSTAVPLHYETAREPSLPSSPTALSNLTQTAPTWNGLSPSLNTSMSSYKREVPSLMESQKTRGPQARYSERHDDQQGRFENDFPQRRSQLAPVTRPQSRFPTSRMPSRSHDISSNNLMAPIEVNDMAELAALEMEMPKRSNQQRSALMPSVMLPEQVPRSDIDMDERSSQPSVRGRPAPEVVRFNLASTTTYRSDSQRSPDGDQEADISVTPLSRQSYGEDRVPVSHRNKKRTDDDDDDSSATKEDDYVKSSLNDDAEIDDTSSSLSKNIEVDDATPSLKEDDEIDDTASSLKDDEIDDATPSDNDQIDENSSPSLNEDENAEDSVEDEEIKESDDIKEDDGVNDINENDEMNDASSSLDDEDQIDEDSSPSLNEDENAEDSVQDEEIADDDDEVEAFSPSSDNDDQVTSSSDGDQVEANKPTTTKKSGTPPSPSLPDKSQMKPKKATKTIVGVVEKNPERAVSKQETIVRDDEEDDEEDEIWPPQTPRPTLEVRRQPLKRLKQSPRPYKWTRPKSDSSIDDNDGNDAVDTDQAIIPKSWLSKSTANLAKSAPLTKAESNNGKGLSSGSKPAGSTSNSDLIQRRLTELNERRRKITSKLSESRRQ